jgi:hypothetical protein
MASDRLRMTNLCCLGGVQASYLKNTTDKTVQFAVDSHYGPSHHDGDSSQRLNNKDYVTTRLSKPEKYLLFKVKEVFPSLSLRQSCGVCEDGARVRFAWLTFLLRSVLLL